MAQLTRTERFLLVLFITLVIFLLQYACRYMDMSTLTSWRWVFTEKGLPGAFLLLAAGVILALPASSLELPSRYTAALQLSWPS